VGESNGTSRQSMSEIEKLRADNTHLRAALDAAEANINLKADWIDATINDMAQGEQDAAEACDVGVKPLVWELFWKQDDGTREAADTVFGQTYHVSDKGWWRIFEKLRPCDGLDAAKAAAQADYTVRILSALHPASPLGAVAMREKAACVAEYLREVSGRNQDGDFYVGEEAAMFAGSVAGEILSEIRAIHLPTPAELLAAAMELPEVKALVDASWQINKDWDGEPEDMAELSAALAPFARKGE